MAAGTRTRPPTGEALDKRLDEAFGPEIAPAQVAVQPPAERPATLDEAMAWLQQHLPRVGKGETAKVEKDGQLKYTYKYADLADVSEALLPLLGPLGLSWRTKPTLMQLPGETGHRFVLEYRLRHVSGEEEAGIWPLPDRVDPQVVGSHITYARRYCLCAVTGLAPGGDDEDGGRAASDAAGRSDTLSEASLSLPPAEAERLVAALEPHAETPLAEYPRLWETVVKRRAANKQSPIEHDGKPLTWSALFGFSLAQRVETLTPMTYRAFWDQAKALGDAGLPWQWEGRTTALSLKLRQQQITEEQRQRGEVLALAIASAETGDQLTAAGQQLAGAHAAKEVTDERYTELLRFYDERVVALARDEAKRAEEVPYPIPWAKSAGSRRFVEMIWAGRPLPTVRGEADAAWERDEISADEHALLIGMVTNRPEPVLEPSDPDGRYGDVPTLVKWLKWQVATAITPEQVEAVSRRAVELNTAGVLPGGPNTDFQLISGQLAERRKLMTEGRYA